MANNFVKIKCNPYTKKIEYYYKNESDEWVPVSSKLSSDVYTNVTIQHKVHEIITEINKVYNLGNKGLEITFEGTTDDFEDVCTELREYFSDYKIECKRGHLILDSANEVMPKITSIFGNLKVTFEEYPNDEIAKELNRFDETVKPVVVICVMGLYSSGKSAFINSLLGNEVLPSASDPTTAKNYKITSSENARIIFYYDGELIELNFDGENYNANKPGELDIIQELQTAVDETDAKSVYAHINQALQVINSFDDNHGTSHIDTQIEVFVPFVNSRLPLGQFDFTIYDTPGSDSNHKEHLQILKESLKGQTNGLPIFVTTPDEMDKEKNNEIIDLIEEMGEALDQTNTLVVVNKSDEKDSDVLLKKKAKGDQLRVTSWHSSRVLFVSSIMGLGSKKQNPKSKDSWTDKQYFKVFKQQYDSFSDPEDDFYMQLYKYDFLPQSRADHVLQEANGVTGGEELVFLNSGIQTVEEEISQFAYKYALYNKCVQARQYLNNAIELVVARAFDAEEESKKIETKIEHDIDQKTKELISRLHTEGEKRATSISTEYVEGMKKEISIAFDERDEKLKIEKSWEEVKSKEKKDERIRAIRKRVDMQYSSVYGRIRQDVGSWSNQYWSKAEEDYKLQCCKVVMESSILTEDQKIFLRDYVMKSAGIEIKEVKMDMYKENIIKDKKILFIKIGEKFDVESCKTSFVNSVNTASLNMSSKAQNDNKKRFDEWRIKLEKDLKSKIAAFNPSLVKLADELSTCRHEIGRLTKQRNILNEQRDVLESLLEFYEV